VVPAQHLVEHDLVDRGHQSDADGEGDENGPATLHTDRYPLGSPAERRR
jgi:hypothetical protein